MNQIQEEKINSTLNTLHKAASNEGLTIIKGLSKGIFRKLRPTDMKDAYIAITREQGEFLYDLLLKNQSQSIVEFGTSFGISTIYLAAAVKQNGGKVITTEILHEKCKVAKENFAKAGLSEYIELREGDALETLKSIDQPIDFLLLDGWNELYIPLLEMLEPHFKKGTLIYTDNANFPGLKPFLKYLKSNAHKYEFQKIANNKGRAELIKYIF